MFRKVYPWCAAIFAALCLMLSFVGSASANLYGPQTVSVSAHCPSMQSIVNLPLDSNQSITVYGSTNGSVKLVDKDGHINKVVSSSSYSFTTTSSDLLQACLVSGTSGSLSFAGQLNIYSANWAGYGVAGFANAPNTYTVMTGSWVVPTANCSNLNNEKSSAATWIGFGSLPYTGSSSLEQIGTEIQCNYFSRIYQAVEEMVPSDKTPVVITSACSDSNQTSCTTVPATVRPGDSITAKISYGGGGTFCMQEYDVTQHWYVTIARSQAGSSQPSARYSAEWIQEAPDPELTNFRQVNFTNCFVDGAAIRNAGPAVEQLTIKPNGSSTIKAQPLGLSGSGNSFSVLFENH